MKLYYSEVLNPRKACAVARHLNAPIEYVHIDLGKGEQQSAPFLALNPNGKVPVLADGDHVVWESNAIMAYLAQRAGSDLWPQDGRQIEILRWLSWDLTHFTHYAGTLYFEHLIKAKFDIGPPDPAAVEEATGNFRKFAEVLNSHLKGRQYVVGDGLTVADFALAVSLPYAQDAKIPVGDFPELQRWHERLNALPAWREPFPSFVAA
ncbi:MAG: glutathione S-transferase family protein [Pseudomonadota bacterium]